MAVHSLTLVATPTKPKQARLAFGATPVGVLANRWGIVLLHLLAMTTATAQGGLAWSKEEIRLAAPAGGATVSAAFPFRNAGGRPVRILAIQPGCDCLAASVEKDTWATGESGELRAVFTLGGRTGLQDRVIAVTTDDAPDKPVRLRLLVDIPETVALRPRMLVWTTGDRPEAKTTEVVVADSAQATGADARCDNPLFQTQVAAGPERGVWRVRVQPGTTARPAQAVVRVNVAVAGRQETHVFYVAVK
jgi:hypothetical protein